MVLNISVSLLFLLIFGILYVHKVNLTEYDYASPYSDTNAFSFCLYFFPSIWTFVKYPY